jgi:site-specific recombinase XerC
MTNNEEYETHHEEYLNKQKDIVSEELRDEHANLILDFLYHRDETLEPSTARNYARELRFLIKHTYDNERLESNPEDWTSQDWNRLIRRVSRERDLKDGSKRNTCYAARALIDWMVETPADKSDIDAPKTTHGKIDEEIVLKPREISELIETGRNSRDKAVIALMYEAALRRTALVQLDVRHYRTEPFARVEIPHKTGVKTGSGRERPITWSQGFLDTWIADHPEPDNPDAPLFCSIRKRDDNSRLSSHAIYTMMKRTVERSDIDDSRVHPHALRHARATAMRKSDRFDKTDVELVMGWTDSTPMHERYEHATSMEEATRTAKRMGIDVGEKDNIITQCPRCKTQVPPEARYCPTCTLKIEGEAPDWWKLFDSVCKDTDPLKIRYGALPAAVPELNDLSPDELDHIQDVYIIAENQMYEDMDFLQLKEDPYDGVTAFKTEEDADEAMELTTRIQRQLGSIYNESPEEFGLSERFNESDLKDYAERVESKDD